MEFQPITPPPTLFPNQPGRSSKKKFFIIGFIGVVVIIMIGIGLMVLSGSSSSGGAGRTSGKSMGLFDIPFLKTIVKAPTERFFETSLPRPIKDITLADIPQYYEIRGIVQNGNHIFIEGQGYIADYNIAQKAIVAATNPKKTGLCESVAMAAGHLYAACNVAGLAQYKDHFKGHEKETERFVVFKINPETFSIEQVYTPRDGLRNSAHYRLSAAADAVWISTQNGVGAIDIKTNTVSFYDRELGVNSPQFPTGIILFDNEHVWVQILAKGESKGGISLFNKTSGKWTGFDSDNLQDRVMGKVDLEGIKLIPGGIQIAFRDGRVSQIERLVEKQYQYSSSAWTKLSDKPTTGDGGIPTYEYMETAYPQPPVYTQTNETGLSALRNPATGQSYATNGRRSYALSPLIGDKRYLLTSATIDVIENSSPFNRILVPLNEGLELSQSFPNPEQYQQLVEFAIQPESLLALVTDSACGGMGCTGKQKAWLVDLKARKLLRAYTAADQLPAGKLLVGLQLQKTANTLQVYNKLGLRIFTIDLSDLRMTAFTVPNAHP